MSTEPLLEVVAGIIWHQGRYLAAQRPAHTLHAGFWEFPGGKVEAGESCEQALARELLEELQIIIKNPCYWQSVVHRYPERMVRVHFYHVHAFAGQAQGLEGQTLCWLLPKEGPNMPFLEADKGLVQELVEYTF